MRLRLISTDFDGTIFAEFENPPVPLRLQELLGQFQHAGVPWVINTGRDLTGLMEVIARARLSVRPDYVVAVEREIYQHTAAGYVPFGDWNERCSRDHAALFARVQADIPRLTAWIEAHHAAEVYRDPWSPLCLLADSNAEADGIEAYVRAYCRTIPNLTFVRNDVYARFCHAAYSKGTALAAIARHLGVTPAEVFAAGDHLNDLPMLDSAVAGHLLAPSNAIPIVKEAVARQAGEISPLPQGHAVEAALRRLASNR
ncbi:MAG TPA: HAD hydrolase family protein [Verrucomicrobiota bacterium]|nr:HAD hydrolase family protein [Verrucomicrobiota bacterium]HNU50428.1 HAD hydrolase family protein [Verrucomicrobiota bacterium]